MEIEFALDMVTPTAFKTERRYAIFHAGGADAAIAHRALGIVLSGISAG